MNEDKTIKTDFDSYLDVAVRVYDYYEGDEEKIRQWWETPQECNGNLAPKQTAMRDHGYKIKTMLNNLLDCKIITLG